MKFTLDKYNEDKLKELFNTNDRNIDVSEFYNAYLSLNNKSISDELINKIKNGNFSEKLAIYYAILGMLEAEYNDPYISEMAAFNKIDEITKLDINEFSNNPYFKNIKCFDLKLSNVKLHYRNYEKNECFIYDNIDIDKHFNEINKFGYFDKEVQYLTLSKKETIWMSITPHEINTMQDSINEAYGNVVVMGLGLGYYAYMISLKDNVKHIDIIEKDPNIIKIFKENILPQFEYKDKISIIEKDAFEFAKCMECDYCFIDLWHNENDGLPMYEKFLKLENPNIKYSYWLEPSFIQMARRCLIILMNEQFYPFSNAKYDKENNYTDHLINRFYELSKDFEISSYNHVEDLLKEENIRKLLKSI